MRRSPLRSITSSLISSVVLALISFSSSSLFAIITTDEDEGFPNDTVEGDTRTGKLSGTPRPLKEELGIEKKSFGGNVAVEGRATAMGLNIFFLSAFSFVEPVLTQLALRIKQIRLYFFFYFQLFVKRKMFLQFVFYLIK